MNIYREAVFSSSQIREVLGFIVENQEMAQRRTIESHMEKTRHIRIYIIEKIRKQSLKTMFFFGVGYLNC